MTKQSVRSNEATWYIPRLKTLRNMYHLKQSDFEVDKKTIITAEKNRGVSEVSARKIFEFLDSKSSYLLNELEELYDLSLDGNPYKIAFLLGRRKRNDTSLIKNWDIKIKPKANS
jgi:DNA-binding XRE family transcriptional regulator